MRFCHSVSFVLTLLYIATRFELRFGLAAVIATAHDILITLGFLALFQGRDCAAHRGGHPDHCRVFAQRHHRRVRSPCGKTSMPRAAGGRIRWTS